MTYVVVSLLAAICTVCAVFQTVYDIKTGTHKLDTSGVTNVLLLVPKLWLRWQVNYLKGSPAIIATALAYAGHIGFETFW